MEDTQMFLLEVIRIQVECDYLFIIVTDETLVQCSILLFSEPT